MTTETTNLILCMSIFGLAGVIGGLVMYVRHARRSTAERRASTDEYNPERRAYVPDSFKPLPAWAHGIGFVPVFLFVGCVLAFLIFSILTS